MAISIYTRAPKEYDFSNLGVGNQMQKYVQDYRQDKQREAQDEKEREASYLKQAKVDPVFTMSTYWQKQQGDKIQEFQYFLAKKYYQTKNKPSLQDQIEIQNHKSALYEWQQELKANQQKYAQAQKEIDKDPFGTKYDKDHFESKVKDWVSGKNDGKLGDDLLLPPKIEDLKGYYDTKNWNGKKQTTVTDHNGVRHTVEVPLTDDEAKARMTNDMFDNPKVKRTVTENFANLPNEEKQKYLDKNQDDPSKAIIDWNWENNGKYAIKTQTKDAPAPEGRNKNTDSIMYGSVSKSPTSYLTIGTTDSSKEKTRDNGEKYNKKTPILTKVDKYGDGYHFAPGNYGDVFTDHYIDMHTGHLTPEKSSDNITLNNIQIKYLPYAEGYGVSPDGKYHNKEGYTVKPIVITKDKNGNPVGLELTDEIRKQIIAKHPNLRNKVMNMESEFKPESDQKEEETTGGKTSKFDKYKRK
jgi:hypothetical protein